MGIDLHYEERERDQTTKMAIWGNCSSAHFQKAISMYTACIVAQILLFIRVGNGNVQEWKCKNRGRGVWGITQKIQATHTNGRGIGLDCTSEWMELNELSRGHAQQQQQHSPPHPSPSLSSRLKNSDYQEWIDGWRCEIDGRMCNVCMYASWFVGLSATAKQASNWLLLSHLHFLSHHISASSSY